MFCLFLIKAVDKLNKKAQKTNNFLQNNQKRMEIRYNENQSNITDNESAKIKSGHGIIQGYNAQALVDNKRQIIVAGEVFGQGGDNDLLKPILDSASDNFKNIGKSDDFIKNKKVIADAGYFSDENFKSAIDKNIDAYISDHFFRKTDQRNDEKNRYRRGTRYV